MKIKYHKLITVDKLQVIADDLLIMSWQANVTHLVSKLNFKVGDKARRLKNIDGPGGRVKKIQKTLTALLKYERIELNYNRADETRGYVDRLISEACRNGPTHQETMELADFWILEKQYVHKLFKVLVPRYENYTTSYTSLFRAPRDCPGHYRKRSVLELKDNIFPSLRNPNSQKYNMIHNILLNEAKKDYRIQKFQETAESVAK